MISYAGKNRATVNFLKTIYFDRPEWVRCGVGMLPATWLKYGDELEDLVLRHPRIFPDYRKGARATAGVEDPMYQEGRFRDCWGVMWDNVRHGMSSIDVEHPLDDWAKLDSYEPPDPLAVDMQRRKRDWNAVRREMEESKARGDIAWGGGLAHGFMYMRLYYLRGFENLMVDIASEDPRLWKLIEMVEGYNAAVINRYIELGAEFMGFGDDLGMQTSLPMSPAAWRRVIKPSYARLLAPCRERSIPVHLHTDGHILEIIPDLIACGVRVVNPQIRANGLRGLQEMAKGRIAINQDLDRQLFPFATPAQIEDHISEVFAGLYLPEGGLMLSAECAPDVPLENIEAICTTMEKLCSPPELGAL